MLDVCHREKEHSNGQKVAFTMAGRKMEIGTISAGKTVLVIRLAWSSMEEVERDKVSLNSMSGKHSRKRNRA